MDVPPLVEINLPSVGESLRNLNISMGQADPILLIDSEYPDWIWSARGPCRAAIKSSAASFATKPTLLAHEKIAKLKKHLRSENRKSIRRNNSVLKSASQ